MQPTVVIRAIGKAVTAPPSGPSATIDSVRGPLKSQRLTGSSSTDVPDIWHPAMQTDAATNPSANHTIGLFRSVLLNTSCPPFQGRKLIRANGRRLPAHISC